MTVPVAAVIVERQAAFGHIIQRPTGSFLPYRPASVAAGGTLPFSTKCFPSVVSVASLPLARVVAAVTVMVDGLRLAHACVVVGLVPM
ncbi:hypothetical protein O9993_05635 [Vibrio lentus]|nr:hypothetical protein [Vibrio lentus]